MLIQARHKPFPALARALVIEGEVIVAMATELMLSTLGVNVVHTAISSESALNLIDNYRFDLAILDLDLCDQESMTVAKRLIAEGIFTIFTTVDPGCIPAIAENVLLLRKPYLMADLRCLLS